MPPSQRPPGGRFGSKGPGFRLGEGERKEGDGLRWEDRGQTQSRRVHDDIYKNRNPYRSQERSQERNRNPYKNQNINQERNRNPYTSQNNSQERRNQERNNHDRTNSVRNNYNNHSIHNSHNSHNHPNRQSDTRNRTSYNHQNKPQDSSKYSHNNNQNSTSTPRSLIPKPSASYSPAQALLLVCETTLAHSSSLPVPVSPSTPFPSTSTYPSHSNNHFPRQPSRNPPPANGLDPRQFGSERASRMPEKRGSPGSAGKVSRDSEKPRIVRRCKSALLVEGTPKPPWRFSRSTPSPSARFADLLAATRRSRSTYSLLSSNSSTTSLLSPTPSSPPPAARLSLLPLRSKTDGVDRSTARRFRHLCRRVTSGWAPPGMLELSDLGGPGTR